MTLMRSILEDNLAYPILLKLDKNKFGSGFLLNADKKLFLITAKHVLFDRNGKLKGTVLELTCQSKSLANNDIHNISIELEVVDILKHETSDVSAIELETLEEGAKKGDYFANFHFGIDVPRKGMDLVHVNAQNSTKLLKDVLISNDVFLCGYPTSLGLRKSPQFDYNSHCCEKGL